MKQMHEALHVRTVNVTKLEQKCGHCKLQNHCFQNIDIMKSDNQKFWYQLTRYFDFKIIKECQNWNHNLWKKKNTKKNNNPW